MTDDNYQPPQAPLEKPEPVRRRPVYGVVVPLLIDIIGTVVVQTIIVVAYAASLASGGASEQEIGLALDNPEALSAFNVALRLVGFGFSFLAGYLCITLSRGESYLYPLVLVVATFLVAWLLLGVGSSGAAMLGWSAFAAALTLAGAALAMRRRTVIAEGH